MGFLSPLEELAEKFNILNFNIRELVHKLSIWGSTDADSVAVRLKTPNAPYFEHHVIPSKKYISEGKIVNSWGSFVPTGTKFWGTSILDENLLVTVDGEEFHNVFVESEGMAKVNFLEYSGEGVEGDVRITVDSSGVESSQVDFILTINNIPSNASGENFVYIIDQSTSKILAKFGKADLVTSLGGIPNTNAQTSPKKFKVSLHLVRRPGNTFKEWVVYDLYQYPMFEYFRGGDVVKPVQ